MPSLGADMEAATLIEWRVKPGDSVQRGDIVAEVQTQKGLIEIEVWESGVIDQLLVQPGVKVPVGSVLATVRSAPAASSARAASAEVTPGAAKPDPLMASIGSGSPVPPTADSDTHSVSEPAAPGTRPAASPSARRLARELDVDLACVHGSGPHGAITREDVTRVAAERPKSPAASPERRAPALPAASTRQPAPTPPADAASAMRSAIGAAMARSKREIPHYYLTLDLDVSRALEWLEAENQRRSVSERLLLAALLLKATALAAREFGEMNGYYVCGAFQRSESIHLGVAIALRQGGLIAPALHDVDRTSLTDLMTRLADLVKRTRGGGLRGSELSDSTLTVTNLGDQGADSVFGIIYPPQVALVGFGKMTYRPWADHGMLGIRPIVTATLAADHRVSDGHTGARFLSAIARKLEEPDKL